MDIDIRPIAFVQTRRQTPEDDDWGAETAAITLVDEIPADALAGIDSFSHVEVIFLFDRVSDDKIVCGARHPRNNPDWPAVGIFAQRGKNRPNRLGSTICRVLGLEGRTLTVAALDAIDGTPVLDLKPVMQEFLPREPVLQPEWSTELMRDYWERRG